MSKYMKLGQVRGAGIYRDKVGDILLAPWHTDESDPDPECGVWVSITAFAEDTLEEFISELRAACTPPADRVLAAARRYVASDGSSTKDFDALVTAVEAYEETVDD